MPPGGVISPVQGARIGVPVMRATLAIAAGCVERESVIYYKYLFINIIFVGIARALLDVIVPCG